MLPSGLFSKVFLVLCHHAQAPDAVSDVRYCSIYSDVQCRCGFYSHLYFAATTQVRIIYECGRWWQGVTVLPAGLFSKVLQLVFTPPDQPMRVCCNEDKTAFHAATVGASRPLPSASAVSVYLVSPFWCDRALSGQS